MSDHRDELASGLVELTEQMEPIFESARGIRARMEADGWSPFAAESAALTWLNGAIANAWAQALR